MYKIWFERTMPAKYAYLLDSVAESVGAGTETPENPLIKLPEAEAIIASAYIDYNGAFMDKAPNLKVISRTGIGINNITVPDATERGIAVVNAPSAPTISTAEHTIALIFAVAKLIKRDDRAIQEGVDSMYFSSHNGMELYGKTLGLIGLGRIGGHVATIANGIGMNVIAYDPYVSDEQAQVLRVAKHNDINSVLQQADVVSVHVPLIPETQNLINAERLAMMKQGSILINAARGGLVDEVALIDALDRGHLMGAGLDVFQVEPPKPDNPLLGREDIVTTPHIASATVAGKDRLWEDAISQAIQVLQGEQPVGLVNKEIWRKQ